MSDINLGREVRIAWVNYCIANGDTKPSHIAPWEELNDFDKGADHAIAQHLREAIRAEVIDEFIQTCIDMARWDEGQGFQQEADAWDWMAGKLDTVLRHDGPNAERGSATTTEVQE